MQSTEPPGASLRALLAAAAGTALATGLVRVAAASTTPASAPGATVDEVVVAGVTLCAAAAACALALGCWALVLAVLGRATGRSLRRCEAVARRLTPAVLRRAVTAGLVVGIGIGGAGAATAAETDIGWLAPVSTAADVQAGSAQATGARRPTVAAADPAALTVGPAGQAVHANPAGPPDAPGSTPASNPPSTPASTSASTSASTAVDAEPGAPPGTSAAVEAPAAAAAPPTAVDAPGTPPRTGSAASSAAPPAGTLGRVVGAETVVVQPGDTLWGIAASRLPGADDASVAAEWPRWYAANAEVVGTDPDLLLPGTALVAPDEGAR